LSIRPTSLGGWTGRTTDHAAAFLQCLGAEGKLASTDEVAILGNPAPASAFGSSSRGMSIRQKNFDRCAVFN
jgi:hypothetical protein